MAGRQFLRVPPFVFLNRGPSFFNLLIPELLFLQIVSIISRVVLLFRKGSLRAGAKPRITDSLFVRSFVRPFVCVLTRIELSDGEIYSGAELTS